MYYHVLRTRTSGSSKSIFERQGQCEPERLALHATPEIRSASGRCDVDFSDVLAMTGSCALLLDVGKKMHDKH